MINLILTYKFTVVKEEKINKGRQYYHVDVKLSEV